MEKFRLDLTPLVSLNGGEDYLDGGYPAVKAAFIVAGILALVSAVIAGQAASRLLNSHGL